MYILNVLHGGCRLGELCSGDIDITTPRLHAQNTNQLLRPAAGFFLRRVFKMSDGPILVRLRRNQSGSQWGFTMQGGYDQGSCLYIQKVRNRVYTIHTVLEIRYSFISPEKATLSCFINNVCKATIETAF